MNRKDAKTRRRRHHSKSACSYWVCDEKRFIIAAGPDCWGWQQARPTGNRKESHNCTQSHSQALSTRTHRMFEVIIRITEAQMFVTVSISTAQSEYMAMSSGVQELTWTL